MYVCQLNKFVADERKKFTIFPEEGQVFSFTKMCDFNQVGFVIILAIQGVAGFVKWTRVKM